MKATNYLALIAITILSVQFISADSGDVCSLPQDAGSCDKTQILFAYDTETNLCHAFVYTGCEGNANRFHSLEDCEDACIKGDLEEPKIRNVRMSLAMLFAKERVEKPVKHIKNTLHFKPAKAAKPAKAVKPKNKKP